MPTTAPCAECCALVDGSSEGTMHRWLRELPVSAGLLRYRCLVCLSELVGEPAEAHVRWQIAPRAMTD